MMHKFNVEVRSMCDQPKIVGGHRIFVFVIILFLVLKSRLLQAAMKAASQTSNATNEISTLRAEAKVIIGCECDFPLWSNLLNYI